MEFLNLSELQLQLPLVPLIMMQLPMVYLEIQSPIELMELLLQYGQWHKFLLKEAPGTTITTVLLGVHNLILLLIELKLFVQVGA